ncbi:MAG: glycoside hydrolase family 127 protein, partial [Clostridia bacterium]|nr:glycoside hydrolase family 127 protein [Clostridia bacterium]
MKTISYEHVELTGGYLFEKQEQNRLTTLDAVYDRFSETGRIDAFSCRWKEGDPNKPHFFWDSDVAKWMEGAAYVLHRHPDPALEKRVDRLVEQIQANQGEDGYFNIYFTVVEP